MTIEQPGEDQSNLHALSSSSGDSKMLTSTVNDSAQNILTGNDTELLRAINEAKPKISTTIVDSVLEYFRSLNREFSKLAEYLGHIPSQEEVQNSNLPNKEKILEWWGSVAYQKSVASGSVSFSWKQEIQIQNGFCVPRSLFFAHKDVSYQISIDWTDPEWKYWTPLFIGFDADQNILSRIQGNKISYLYKLKHKSDCLIETLSICEEILVLLWSRPEPQYIGYNSLQNTIDYVINEISSFDVFLKIKKGPGWESIVQCIEKIAELSKRFPWVINQESKRKLLNLFSTLLIGSNSINADMSPTLSLSDDTKWYIKNIKPRIEAAEQVFLDTPLSKMEGVF